MWSGLLNYKKTGKRFLDLLLSLGVAIPFIAISLLIIIVSAFVFKGKVFFLQQRLGYQNRVFRVYKFTTLIADTKKGQALSDTERQTAWGKFLRDYSLDELPQILNIIKGEMSFVGPRPLLPEYKELYTPEEAIRHEVKPGLTGLAQVNGRNALEWNEKMKYDQLYVAQLSLVQDIRILSKTAGVILKGQSVNFGKGPKFSEPKMAQTLST